HTPLTHPHTTHHTYTPLTGSVAPASPRAFRASSTFSFRPLALSSINSSGPSIPATRTISPASFSPFSALTAPTTAAITFIPSPISTRLPSSAPPDFTSRATSASGMAPAATSRPIRRPTCCGALGASTDQSSSSWKTLTRL
ncbi:unnamed protein product, partial [Closterium sp. NIES-54]